MSAFRKLVQDAATQAGGGSRRFAKQSDFPVRNSGQPLTERERQTARLLPRFNQAAERRQAKEAGFSPLLQALARSTAGHVRRELETGPDEHTRAARTDTRQGHTSNAYEVQGDPPPRRVAKSKREPVAKMSAQVAHLAKQSDTAMDKDLPKGWIAAYPEGSHPSRGKDGFWAGRADWVRRERGGK